MALFQRMRGDVERTVLRLLAPKDRPEVLRAMKDDPQLSAGLGSMALMYGALHATPPEDRRGAVTVSITLEGR